MKDIKEEAERARKAKLEKYGADEKACGGRTHRADGGKVHDDKAEDEKLLHRDLKPSAFKHRDMGGPIAGGAGPKLGRGRKGKSGKTNVNVVVAPKGNDGPPAMPPPNLGAGPAPSGPLPGPGPRPMPAPGGPAGPMKRGGKVEKKHKK